MTIKRLSVVSALLMMVGVCFAVVATPEPILHEFPDGSVREVYLRGDEYYHYLTTTDGEIVPGSEVSIPESHPLSAYHRAPNATKLYSYVPNKGTVRIPVILVNFTDKAFTIEDPVASFHDLFNGKGGKNPNATGSVHDYYIASSNGELNLIYEVFGPYTLSHDMAYYGCNSTYGDNTRVAIEEAAQLAVDAGVDLSVYDNNGDGTIDNLSVVVAGYNEAEGGPSDAIWPHYSVVSTSKTFSGKRLAGYLVISEYRGSRGSVQAGIGTYCHEFGHALGLVDLYDTETSDNYTVGAWDVMCNGSYNNNGSTPPTFSAFERFWLGWLTPTQLSTPGEYALNAIETHNEAYLIAAEPHNLYAANPSPKEYFLIENRQAKGWDANADALIAPGLLVAHISFDLSAWNYNRFNNQKPLGYAIVSAGRSNPDSSTPADVFPGTSNVYQWTPTLNDGEMLRLQQIANIRVEENDSSIHFTYGEQKSNSIHLETPRHDTLITPYKKGIVSYDSVLLTATFHQLENDTVVLSISNAQFAFSIDEGHTWHNGSEQVELLAHTITDSRLPIYVRFQPTRQSCNIQSGRLTIQNKDKSRTGQQTLYGYAPRPTYIQAPQVLPFTDVASTSFTAHWTLEEDAAFYYATLYYIDNAGEKQYICKEMEREFSPITDQAIFTNLTPGTTYYFSIAAYEDKGCEPHYISSAEVAVSTLSESGAQKPIKVIRSEDGQYTVILPESADGSTELRIYTCMGELVQTIQLPYGTTHIELEMNTLPKGQLYLLKLVGNKLQRKSARGKMLFP